MRVALYRSYLDQNNNIPAIRTGRYQVREPVREEQIIPESDARDFPEVPDGIMHDYREASLIADRSPRGAAILLRRSLEALLVERYGIREGGLKSRLKALKQMALLEPRLVDALAGIRVLGNDAAHAGNDQEMSDEDIWTSDVGRQNVDDAIRGLEILFDATYVQDRKTLESLDELDRIASREKS